MLAPAEIADSVIRARRAGSKAWSRPLPRNGRLSFSIRLQIEIIRLQLHRIVEMDGEIGLAVAIGVALDPGVGLVLDRAQFAGLAVKSLVADEAEILVAGLVCVGVPAVDVDNVAIREL